MTMATILLHRHEVEDRELPFVCLRCGRPAGLWKTKQFFLAAPTGVAAVGKLTRVEVPLCPRHKRHWLWRGLFGALGALFVAGFLIPLFAFEESNQVPPAWRNIFGAAFAVSFLGLILWVPGMLILHFTSVRPRKVTEDDITLAGVSPTFVQELEEYRQSSRGVRKKRRRSGRRRRDDFED
jgi:hypothetical protein